MSFCPICGQGSGNGGDPCRACEGREARAEALTLDAKRVFRKALKQWDNCTACEHYRPTYRFGGEPLCEECFAKEYVETEMK